MDILLDTHALVWFLNGDKKLSRIVKDSIENPDIPMLFEFARANSCKSAYTDEISQVKFANRNDAAPMRQHLISVSI